MIDVKKLVIGFLVLAVATSASALLISRVGSSAAIGEASGDAADISLAAGAGTNNPVSAAQYADNAFLPQTDGNNAATDADVTAINTTSTDDPNNLSDILANTYLNDLVTTNPNGAETDNNGNPSLTPPDSNSVIQEFQQLESGATSTLNNVDIPDWDLEAAKIPVITTSNFTTSTAASYTAAVQDIFNQDFIQPNLEGMLNGNSDSGAAAFVTAKIQSALADIAGMQVPAPAADFQKSLVKLLVYQKNIAALVASDSADPLKTALIMEAEDQKYAQIEQEYKTQFQDLSMLPEFSPIAKTDATSNRAFAFVDNLFGIKTANAIFGVGDIDFDPTVFGQMLISYAEDIALQILKNFVIHEMQATVLKWVAGSGAPQFVQNWGETLVKAGTQAAIGAINSQYQCISASPFAAQIKLNLTALYPTSNNACMLNFNNALSGSSLKSFYNNFSSGGWVAFGSTMKPDNDYYGALFFTAQAAANSAQSAQNAAQAKNVASGGWKSKAVCDDGMDPDTGCKLNDTLNAGGLCVSRVGGSTYEAVYGDKNGECADGEDPEDIQPGQVVGQVFNSAVDSSGKLTAGANTVAGLLDAFLSSLLNSLATNVIQVAGGALNNLGSSGASGPGGNPQAGSVPISCTATMIAQNPDVVQFTGSGGQVISLNGSSIGTSGNPSYAWSVDGGGIPSTAAGPGFQATFNSSGTYTATITDVNSQDATNGVQPSTICTVSVP